jgi:hypothetical protein
MAASARSCRRIRQRSPGALTPTMLYWTEYGSLGRIMRLDLN